MNTIRDRIDEAKKEFHGQQEPPRQAGSNGGRKAGTAQRNWLHACIVNDKHQPLPILANVLTGLEAELPDTFAYDEMACVPMLMKPLRGENSFTPRPCTDIDVGIVQARLQHLGLQRISKDVVHQAVDMRAAECRFHPVRDYLEGLNWDGLPRIQAFFPSYFGAVDDAYAQQIGQMFLISMVARIFSPGCKADHMPVIEGPQGMMKSTACRILGGPWFSTPCLTSQAERMSPSISEENGSSKLAKCTPCLAPRQLYSKASSLGRMSVTGRPTAVRRSSNRGSASSSEPRTKTSTCATRLEGAGFGRPRQVPSRLMSSSVIAKVFAEAVNLFRTGSTWWPDKDFEREHIAPQQSARYEADVWEEKIGDYLATNVRVTVGQVAMAALSFDTAKIGKADQIRIAAALDQLGWKRERADGKTDWQGKRWWVKA